MLILNYDFIEKNNMIVEDKGNDIYFIKNFLNDKEYNAFIDMLNNTSEEEWRLSYWTALKNRALTLYNSDDLLTLIANKTIEDPWEFFGNYQLYHDKTLDSLPARLDVEILQSLQDKWKNVFTATENDYDNYDWDTPYSIERRYVGTSTPIHRDNDPEGALIYATILYINDDFEGGDIFFPECGVSLQPEKGSLCIFSGITKMPHGVREVTQGTRYSIPIFVWDITKDQTYRTLHK